MANDVQKKSLGPSVNLHVRVPAAQYDAMYAQARASRLTMADWIRRVLRQAQPTFTIGYTAPQPGARSTTRNRSSSTGFGLRARAKRAGTAS